MPKLEDEIIYDLTAIANDCDGVLEDTMDIDPSDLLGNIRDICDKLLSRLGYPR